MDFVLLTAMLSFLFGPDVLIVFIYCSFCVWFYMMMGPDAKSGLFEQYRVLKRIIKFSQNYFEIPVKKGKSDQVL